MINKTVTDTEPAGLQIMDPFYQEDNRGYFLKSYEKERFEKLGLPENPDEIFESYSKKWVIRGLHFQTRHLQDKLVHAVKGSIFDVAVDLRKESATFGEWRGYYLFDDKPSMLFIPKGFAHGFLTLSEEAIVSYTCFGKYDKESDSGIRWNDAVLDIKWPVPVGIEPIVSKRDQELQTLNQFLKSTGGLL